MKRRLLATIVVLATFAVPLSAEPRTQPQLLLGAESLLPHLKRGGIILVMRHQRAAMTGKWDDFTKTDADCSAQRNLSPAGYAGATETGNAFATLGIRFTKVISSPLCRTVETARLIFGHVERNDGLGHISELRKFSTDDAARELKNLVTNNATNQQANTAIITHGGNILAAYQQSLSEGDMLFLSASTDGMVKLIGRTSASDFDLLANAEILKRVNAKQNSTDE